MSAFVCLTIGLIDTFVAEPGSTQHLRAGGLLLVALSLGAAGYLVHLAATRACRVCSTRLRKTTLRCTRCSADIVRPR